MDSFKGKYERTSIENGDEVLKALGANWIIRKASSASTPIMEVTENGGVWSIKTSTTLKTMELKFKLGEEVDDTTPDGREVVSVITHEGDKLICVQKAKKQG